MVTIIHYQPPLILGWVPKQPNKQVLDGTLQFSIRMKADRALKISKRVSIRALRLSNFEIFRALKVSNRVL